jgi:hypothetical protein
MKFSTDPVDAVFLRVKIIKAAFKADHQEKQQTGSNANGEPEGIDNGITLISFQVSDSGFEIIFEHGGWL